MSKPFDTTTRDFFGGYPGPLLDYLGLVPDGPIEVVDTNISTVVAEVDKVFRIDGAHPYLIHIEFQASADSTLPRRCLRYSSILDLRHDLRVRTFVVLLRPEDDTGNLTGVLDLRLPDGRRIVEFHYEVVRAWERPVEPILAGSLGLLPLAPLADVPLEQVPAIIERIDRRLVEEAPAATAGTIMNATLLLAGLRMEKDKIDELRGRLQTMNITSESSYYRLIVEEGMKEGMKEGIKKGVLAGKMEESRRVILRLGQIRFGPPSEDVHKAIEAINDVDRLEQLSDRLLGVSSWAELLSETAGNEPPSS